MNSAAFTFPYLLIVTILTAFNAQSQGTIAAERTYDSNQIVAATDASEALEAGRVRRIRLLSSPEGNGTKTEAASSDPNDLYYFEREHNVVWIKFKAIKKSGMAFTIIPDSEKDDYDFLLFKVESKNTLSKIQKRQLLPIRSNIARTKNINGGNTGLRLNEKKTHNSSGINAGFSQTLDVEDGDEFYLVIDNVYSNGSGATIDFMYFKEKLIEGTVIDSEQKPVEAEVIWQNAKNGVELAKTISNPEDGTFSMTIPYESELTSRYTMTIYSDDCLFKEVSYAPVEIETVLNQKLSVILPKLKKGAIAQMSSINFMPNKPVFVKSAYPSLRRLARLMKKNRSLKILVVGHTNGCDGGLEKNQQLSEDRAKVTRDYLVSKGISGSRITMEGRNCREMLFPKTNSTRLQKLNRRIEINVTSY